jgi:hypothetical protein
MFFLMEIMMVKAKTVSNERSFVLSKVKIELYKKRFEEITKDVPHEIKEKAGNSFFNPFRSGIYFAQVQVLYLLGANKYHGYKKVEDELKIMLFSMIVKTGEDKGKNKWEVLTKDKDGRKKDHRGKIQHNYTILQRLGKNSPYGYKLAQVLSSIDIYKNVHNLLEYKLNTKFDRIEDIEPFSPQRRTKNQIKFLVKSGGVKAVIT